MVTASQAQRIGRGRTMTLSYQIMRGETEEGDRDDLVVEAIADLLLAAVNEPFERAGLPWENKADIAAQLMAASLIATGKELRAG